MECSSTVFHYLHCEVKGILRVLIEWAVCCIMEVQKCSPSKILRSISFLFFFFWIFLTWGMWINFKHCRFCTFDLFLLSSPKKVYFEHPPLVPAVRLTDGSPLDNREYAGFIIRPPWIVAKHDFSYSQDGTLENRINWGLNKTATSTWKQRITLWFSEENRKQRDLLEAPLILF